MSGERSHGADRKQCGNQVEHLQLPTFAFEFADGDITNQCAPGHEKDAPFHAGGHGAGEGVERISERAAGQGSYADIDDCVALEGGAANADSDSGAGDGGEGEACGGPGSRQAAEDAGEEKRGAPEGEHMEVATLRLTAKQPVGCRVASSRKHEADD